MVRALDRVKSKNSYISLIDVINIKLRSIIFVYILFETPGISTNLEHQRCLTLNGMGFEKSMRYWGWIPDPSLFPLFEGQLKQNLVV